MEYQATVFSFFFYKKNEKLLYLWTYVLTEWNTGIAHEKVH